MNINVNSNVHAQTFGNRAFIKKIKPSKVKLKTLKNPKNLKSLEKDCKRYDELLKKYFPVDDGEGLNSIIKNLGCSGKILY